MIICFFPGEGGGCCRSCCWEFPMLTCPYFAHKYWLLALKLTFVLTSYTIMPEFSHIRSFPFLFLSHAGTHLVRVSSSLPDISSARPV